MAALRFFYLKTLKRPCLHEDLPWPKRPRKLPQILSLEEVAKLIDSASNLFHRAMLMTLYSTGVRRAEMCRLQVSDIDSRRMIVHIRKGKGGHDRDVPLSEKLLETLRVYWRWMKPRRYLFPGTVKNQASGCSTNHQGSLASLPTGRQARRDHHAHRAAYATPLFCNPSARSGSRPAHHSSASWS